MKKEIREIITKNGEKICRVTTPDERFYGKQIENAATGLPEIRWYPSATWIKSYWYVSPYLIKWIAEKGLTESEIIKKEAGLKGDKIHQATESIDRGEEIKINDKILNKETGELEELTVEEYEAIIAYRDWVDAEKPELLANEMTIFSPAGAAEQYAGTLDRIIAKGFVKPGVRQIYIVDIKTGQSVYKDMIIQLSAYSRADIDYRELKITEEEWKNRKLLILQVGYRKNSHKYKATEVDERYDLFQIAYQTWKEENPEANPSQKDLPLAIKSKFRTIGKELEVKNEKVVKLKIK